MIIFGCEVVFYKIWEHLLSILRSKTLPRSFPKRKLFIANCHDICFFYFNEKLPCVKQESEINRLANIYLTQFTHAHTDYIISMSFIWIKFADNVLIPSIQISKCNFSVIKGKGDDYVLPLSINEHCFAKTDLKVLVFSFKSVINLSRWNTGNFFTIKRALNKVQ